jgi:hypothetical protein
LLTTGKFAVDIRLRRVRIIAKSDYYLFHARRPSVYLSACPSIRMEELGSHRTDFDEI